MVEDFRIKPNENVVKSGREILLSALQSALVEITIPQDLPTLLQTILEQAICLLQASGGNLSFGNSCFESGLASPGTTSPQAVLKVPLQWQGQTLGEIQIFNHDQREMFTKDDRDLMTLFASQATIAIENLRLLEAEHKAHARAEALTEAVRMIGTSLSLREVTVSLLNQLARVLPYDSGNVMLREENLVTVWAWRGYDAFHDPALIQSVVFDVIEDHPVGKVVLEKRPLVISDTQQNLEWKPTRVSGHIRSWMGVPLLIRDQVIGLFSLDRIKPGGFSEEEITLAQTFALHAATGIENARLFEKATVERRHLRLLYDVGRGLTASLEADEILNRAISLTCQAMGGMVGEAFLYSAEEDILHLRALYGRSVYSLSELDKKLGIRSNTGLVGWVTNNRQPVCIPDVAQDPRWHYVPGVDDDIHSAISSPILAGENLLGVLTVLHQQTSAFTKDHLDLMQAICQEVGLALSNAQRYQQVQRRLSEITLIQNLAQTFNQRLELPVLLDEVVTQLAQKFGYPQVRIYLVEGDALVLKAIHGPHPSQYYLKSSEGIIGQVVRTGEVAYIPDVTQDPDYQIRFGQTVSKLAVPIFREKIVVGVINIECDQPDQLSLQDRDILQVLAGQISVALENAVLYERVRQHARDLEHTIVLRTAELTELFELSQEIGFQLSFDDLLRLLLRHLRSAVRSEMVMGYLGASGSTTLVIEASRPILPTVLSEIRSRWLWSLAIHGGFVADPQQLNVEIIQAEDYESNAMPIRLISGIIMSPVIVEQRIVGVLMAGNEKPDAFVAEQERLLNTFANQAAGAYQRLSTLLAAQQKHLESLVEHMPVGTLLFDAEFNLLVVNPLGREILNVLGHSADSKKIEALGSYTLQDLISHQNDPLPVEIILDSLPRRYFDAQIRPVGDSLKGAKGEDKNQWVLTIREVTREREMQARVQSQERLATVGQLAAGIAHDFNNIMAAILVYADLLRTDTQIPRASRDKLSIIQQQVQRASSLIRQILDFSRRSVMDQSSLDLLPFVKELDKLLGRVLPETIRLELTYQPTSYWVNADPTRLQQVFMNLALNARDAMADGGILHFELNRWRLTPEEAAPFPNMPAGDWIRITVSDTGAGIPEEAQPHLFEPFFTTKPSGQGTGLGLAQVYGIIKQHNGYIDYKSQEGEGTTFIIYLPALQLPQENKLLTDTPAQLNGMGQTVLVVEDDESTRQAIHDLMSNQNYTVLTASNGNEALEFIEHSQNNISLVVSDVVMPQMGGMMLYRALQALSPGIKMLFVTGHPMDEENQDLLEKGKVKWLQKPFSIKEFNQALNELLKI